MALVNRSGDGKKENMSSHVLIGKANLPPLVLVVCCAWFTLVACPQPDSPPIETNSVEEIEHLFDMMPDGDYFLAGHLDLERFAASELGSKWIEFSDYLSDWQGKFGININLFKKVALLVAYPQEPALEPPAIFLLEGDIDKDALFDLLGEKGKYFKPEPFQGKTIYVLKDVYGFAFVKSNLVAFGSPDLVRRCVLVAAGRGKSLMKGSGFKPFSRFINSTDQIWLGINGVDRLLGSLSSKHSILKNFVTLTAGYIGISVEKDIMVHSIAQCSDEEDAREIADGLRHVIGITRLLIKTKEFDDIPLPMDAEEFKRSLLEMVSSFRVERTGGDIYINLTIPESILNQVMDITKEVLAVGKHEVLRDRPVSLPRAPEEARW